MENNAKALVITVHHKINEGVLALLDSLRELREFPKLNVLIADNSSGEECLSRIRSAIAQLSNVELVESATNRGYLGAARFALDHYLAQSHGIPDWVIVCNHDVLIPDPGFVEKLLRHNPDGVGVIGPRILAPPLNIEQNPFLRRRPGVWRRATMRFYSADYRCAVIWDWLARTKRKIAAWFSRRAEKHLEDGSAVELVYAIHGAFMVFSRKYFESGGYLDTNLFLFGEEISVAEICRSRGLSVIYDPSLKVIHEEHLTTGKRMTRFAYEYHRKAVRHLMSQYLGS